MSHATLNTALIWLQCGLGVAIMLGGLALSAAGVDAMSRRLVRWAITGLVCWGAWFALHAYLGLPHDSMPALALAALVAYVLLVHGRQVRGILDGEDWWPPNAANMPLVQSMAPRRPPAPWYRKLNPWWLLFGNDDDGYFGDPDWRAGRTETLGLAVIWWLRNPAHNLTWYGIGVADKARLNVGRWAPEIHRPGGGLLTCWTEVQVLGFLWVALPFISYLSPHVKAYAGWRPSGAFGFKLNLSWSGSIEVQA